MLVIAVVGEPFNGAADGFRKVRGRWFLSGRDSPYAVERDRLLREEPRPFASCPTKARERTRIESVVKGGRSKKHANADKRANENKKLW